MDSTVCTSLKNIFFKSVWWAFKYFQMIAISWSFYLLCIIYFDPLLPFIETHLTNNTAYTFFSPTVHYAHVWLWVHVHAKSSSMSLTLWSDQSGLPGAYTLLCCADLHATCCKIHTLHKLTSKTTAFLLLHSMTYTINYEHYWHSVKIYHFSMTNS